MSLLTFAQHMFKRITQRRLATLTLAYGREQRTGKGRTYIAQHDHLQQQQCDPTHQPTAASFLDKTFVFDNRKPLGEGRQQDMHDIPSTHDGISHLQIHPLTQS